MRTAGKEVVRARQEEPFLECFIEAYQPFILRMASKYAGFLVTRSDDEFSIALLAFYEAVKHYDPAGGSFGAFASLVIWHRLADYYRSQRHFETEIPLSPQVFDGAVDRDMPDFSVQMEVSQSLSQKDSETAAWEIEAANQQLSPYGFSLTDLCVPHAEKPRRDCARAAAVLLQCPELMAELRRLQRLPVKRLAVASRVRQSVIERHRRYIIAAVLLVSGNYPRLCAYLEPVKNEMHAVACAAAADKKPF